jgi:diaminopimelate epimerase
VRRDATGAVVAASVDMGIPVHGAEDLAAVVDGVEYRGDVVSMGNPHLVLFVDDPTAVPVAAHGPVLERDPRFPNRTNVHFVAVDGPDRLRVVTWERGAGATLSCGTGASASAAVARRRGLVGDAVTVAVPGGELETSFTANGTIVLAGPVVHVFGAHLGAGLATALDPVDVAAVGSRPTVGRRTAEAAGAW